MIKAAMLYLSISICLWGAEPASVVKPDSSVAQVMVVTPSNGGANVTPFGTAFFLSDDGLLATAAHVYLKALTTINDNRAGVLAVGRYSKANRDQWSATFADLVVADYQHDLVLLRLRNVDKQQWNGLGGITPLELADSSTLADGETSR